MEVNKTKGVADHLKTHGSITAREAYNLYGTMRLSAIIFRLKKLYDIGTEMVEEENADGKKVTYAKYIYKGVRG